MRVGSLCTGIGGLDLAVEHHFGAELAWYSEIEPAPCTVLEREWPGVPNLGDLTVVDWSQVEPVDILTAGYPCQPFSHAGKRKGASDVRHLWPFIAAAVRGLRPRLVVLENVAGHLSLGFGTVLGDLAEAGFDAEWCLLRASDVGACHRRARVFIVATDSRCSRAGGHARAVPRSAEEDRRPQPDVRPSVDGGEAASDAGGMGRRSRTGLRPDGPVGQRRGRPSDGDGATRWGPYEAAVRRWEVLTRPAPPPTDDGQLAPSFVEWMMGYPVGWTDSLSRAAALKALGNAVVPMQALAALRDLHPHDLDGTGAVDGLLVGVPDVAAAHVDEQIMDVDGELVPVAVGFDGDGEGVSHSVHLQQPASGVKAVPAPAGEGG